MELSGKTRIVVIATWVLWNSMMCFSNDNKFSSVLETVVDVPVNQAFHIFGRNGFCAHAYNSLDLVIFRCGRYPLAETFTFQSDGTLRIPGIGRRLTATGFTQGSTLIAASCTTPPTPAALWKILPGDRQIMHLSSGLVLSAIGNTELTRLTLKKNIYSSTQTWRLDKEPAFSSAYILGMYNLCLHYSFDSLVWLGLSGSVGAGQQWYIYPDSTIRPYENSSLCLSSENLKEWTVLVTICDLSLTSERWLFTQDGTILNEHTDLVLDVAGANPRLKKIRVEDLISNAEYSIHNPNP